MPIRTSLLVALLVILNCVAFVSAFHAVSRTTYKSRSYVGMMARKPFIAGNWKMNTDLTTAIQLANDLVEATKGLDHSKVEVAVIPP